MSTPEEYFRSLPPITRAWLVIAVTLAALTGFQIVGGHNLVWYPQAVLPPHLQVWRLITSLVYLGGFSLSFAINLLTIVQFGPAYEQNPFATTPGAVVGGTADVVFSLLVSGIMLIAADSVAQIYFNESLFVGAMLVTSLTYLWSKRYPLTPINIWGIRLQGRYFPWARLAIIMLMGMSPVAELVGIAAAHVFYFLVDVLPAHNGGARWLNTPQWLIHLVDYINDTNTYVPPAPGPGGRRFGAVNANANVNATAGGGGASGGGVVRRPSAAAAASSTGVVPPRTSHTWGQGRRLGDS